METWWVDCNSLYNTENACVNDAAGEPVVQVVKLADVEALERRVCQAEALVRGLLSNPAMYLPELTYHKEAFKNWLAAEPRKE